jgi:Ca2+-binding RTX toxin-like protein
MHPINRRLALLAPAIALLAAAPAHAQTAGAVATVTSSAAAGMSYNGTNGDDNVIVTLAASTFTVDDSKPIQPGAGCTPVAGDPSKVTCVAFKTSGGSLKKFEVFLNGGADSVKNLTPAPMNAKGGSGNDTLDGSAKATDEMLGESGNDDLRDFGGFKNILRGGTGNDGLYGGTTDDTLEGSSGDDDLNGGGGNDTLDGGVGADTIDGGASGVSPTGLDNRDIVTYAGRLANVSVNLSSPDGPQGVSGENDKIRDVEIVFGGAGDDVLIGDGANNTLFGGVGNDFLGGEAGADTLVGQDGNDTLFPSPMTDFFGQGPDGAVDKMDCGDLGVGDGDPGDFAVRALADGDFVTDCAKVTDV